MDANQTGGGLAFANALGVAFSQSQIRGGAVGGSNIDIFSTVTLLLNGNTLTAEPGDSSVDIGASITGQNVQYISQMAGTTMINSPTMINGNLVLPHQYNFSMNPELNPSLPTATINATINVGTTTLNPAITLYPTTFDVASGDAVFTTPSFGVSGSNVSIVTSTIATTAQTVTTTASTITNTALTTFAASAKNTAITAVSSLTISSLSSITEYTGVLGVTAYKQNIYTSNLYDNYAGYITLTADQGANLGVSPEINIVSQNGAQGRVKIRAESGIGGTAFGGLVDIQALGGNNPLVGLGGTLLLQAFSGGYGSFGGLTSRVAVNGANVSLSAGAISGLPGLAGSMNIFGEGLVSIVSALLPPTSLQIPQSVYIYGNGGVRLESPLGVQSLSPFYTGTIYPIANGNTPLIIRGRSLPSAGVQIMDCEKINMVSPNGLISGVSSLNYLSLNNPYDISGLSTINGQPLTSYAGDPHLWSYYNQLSSLSSITADNGSVSSLYVSSLNGTPFAPWYNVPAAGPVSMNQNSINNASYIITSNFYTTELNGQYSGVDMGKLTMKASTLSIAASTISMLNLSTVNGNSYIDTRSWATVPATVGIDANGKNIGNVGTIFANDVVVGNSIIFTNPDGIIDINDNALINVSSIQPSAGNAISFANAGLINVSTINGYPINSIVNSWVSTATTQLDMDNFNIVNTNVMTANTFLTSIFTADNISTGSLTCFGEITSVDIAATGNIFTLGEIGAAVHITSPSATFQSIINLSSINGAPYTGGSAWNGSATTDLNMNSFNITNATNVGVVNLTANSLITSLTAITTPLYNGTNMNLSGTITTPGVAMSPTNVTIGGPVRTTTLDGGGLYADGVSLNYVNTSKINNYVYANGSKLVLTNYIIPDDGSVHPTVYYQVQAGAAGYYYFSAADNNKDYQAALTFTGSDGSPFNASYAGRYYMFNNNAVNNMYVFAQVVWNGNYTAAAAILINPGQALTFEVVPTLNTRSDVTFNKIAFTDYRTVAAIIPIAY